MQKYDHKKIEEKWQGKWRDADLHKIVRDGSKDKEYVLVEFPYPSGDLHVGHWYAFAVPDIYARFKRMQGKNVLFPIGFDAFGLPAENAAIKHGLNPREWTYKNMDTMRSQMDRMGASFDTSRELATCDPVYYKWTQWIFTKFYEAGLVEQKKTPANWCPSCKTVLANEQVINNTCERCDSEVDKKNMMQWSIDITKYADRLINDLTDLDWPQQIKDSQINWIGRSEGAEIDFKVKGSAEQIKVFTTRPDTLFGATYMVLAPEHSLVQDLKGNIENWSDVEEYIKEAGKKSHIERGDMTKEKTGVELEGVKAINPANNEELPIYIADYVMADYGTGAIMAVPAHDERDYEFAKKFDIEIKTVIANETGTIRENEEFRDGGAAIIFDPKTQKYAVPKWADEHYGLYAGGVDEGETIYDAILREVKEESGFINYDIIEWVDVAHAHYYHKTKRVNRVARGECLLIILKDSERQEVALEKHEDFELIWDSAENIKNHWERRNEDNGFTHYIEFLNRGVARAIELGVDKTSDPIKFVAVPRTNKGIVEMSGNFSGLSSEEGGKKITEFVGGKMTTSYKLRDWNVSRQRYWGVPIPIVHCDKCGVVPVPKDQLPVELPEIDDYLPTGDGKSPLAKVDDWVNVKCPKCRSNAKRETDTLDTFVDSSWYYLRYLDVDNNEEFSNKSKQVDWMPIDLYLGGAEHTTMHLLYSRFWHKALYDLGLVAEKEPYKRRLNRGLIMGPDGNKMSKSKGNVINPDEIVQELGADTVRTYLAFIGPYNEVGNYPWSPKGIVGIRRFLDKVYALSEKVIDKQDENVERELHKAIKKVTGDNNRLKFNTAISALMIFLNLVEKKGLTNDQFKTFLKILSPFAPHMTQELWSQLGNDSFLLNESWPSYDESKLVEDSVTVVLQVNGKNRSEVTVPVDITEEEIKELALADEAVDKWVKKTGEGVVKRFVYITGRLANIVVQ